MTKFYKCKKCNKLLYTEKETDTIHFRINNKDNICKECENKTIVIV